MRLSFQLAGAVLLLSSLPALAQDAPDAAADAAAAAAAAADADAESVPWQAQIYTNFTDWTEEELKRREDWDLAHRCGGSLIAPGWVLTAAHCITQAKVDKGYRVRLGAHYLDLEEGVTYRIDRMVRHADYDAPTHLNDIALVHYVADAETDEEDAGSFSPIALYDGPPLPSGTEVFATGWGQAEEEGQGLSGRAHPGRSDHRRLPIADSISRQDRCQYDVREFARSGHLHRRQRRPAGARAKRARTGRNRELGHRLLSGQ